MKSPRGKAVCKDGHPCIRLFGFLGDWMSKKYRDSQWDGNHVIDNLLKEIALPRMFRVKQEFDDHNVKNIAEAVHKEFQKEKIRGTIRPGISCWTSATELTEMRSGWDWPTFRQNACLTKSTLIRKAIFFKFRAVSLRVRPIRPASAGLPDCVKCR